MSYKHPWEMPTFVYFLGAALCLGGAGASCDFLSRELPAGNATAAATGASLGFILFAVFLCFKGIFNWKD